MGVPVIGVLVSLKTASTKIQLIIKKAYISTIL
jgi:hypothetical protein